MIALEPHAEGVVLPVHARPASRKTGILGEHGERLKVAVAAAPEHGQANQALVATLAAALDLHRSQLSLLSGATNRSKRFLVRGVDQSELARRLAAVLVAR